MTRVINPRHDWHATIPGKRDAGQRFVVTYKDGAGTRRVYGCTDCREVAESFVDQIKQRPAWRAPRIRDRRAAA